MVLLVQHHGATEQHHDATEQHHGATEQHLVLESFHFNCCPPKRQMVLPFLCKTRV